MEQDFIRYLKDLIGFKSITPSSKGSVEYIEKLLKDAGFSTEIKHFGEAGKKVTNLYASYGTKSPNICFLGHVDVVPPGDTRLWKTPPFIATEIDDKIHGRGSVDMKGGVACMLDAALSFLKKNKEPNGTFSFLITSDEEGDAKYGTQKMLKYIDQKGVKIDFAIVGEPTSVNEVGDTMKIGRRGSANFILTVHGSQGHTAYPEKADNPNNYMVKVLNDLISTKIDDGNELFQPSNLEIASIDVGNPASNVIPASVSAKFNVRFNDLQTKESVKKFVSNIAEKYCKKYDLTMTCNALAFSQDIGGRIAEFAEVVESQTGISPHFSTSGGTSDARFIKNYCPVVEFGLLSDLAHRINEYTKISDLQRLYNVYYYTLCKFLG